MAELGLSCGRAGLPRQVTERRLRTECRSHANRQLQILLAAVLTVAAAAPNRLRNQSEPSFEKRRVSIPRAIGLSPGRRQIRSCPGPSGYWLVRCPQA